MARLRIEVCYATAQRQEVVALEMEEGARAIDAVLASGLAGRYPQIDLAALVLGIFGKVVAPDTVLRAGDRVEIYRPLTADPKQARRARAAQRARRG